MNFLKTRKDVTIDELIRVLQRAKRDIGGDAKVLVNHNDDYCSLELAEVEAVEGSYGYYEWVGDPDDEYEYDGSGEKVLTLYTH